MQDTYEDQILFEGFEGEACANANIGSKERLFRLGLGSCTFAFALALVITLCFFDVSRWWRLLSFPIFLAAGIMLLSSQQKVCVTLAVQGKSSFSGKISSITDQLRLKALRKKGAMLILGSFLFAFFCVVGFLLIPENI